MSSVSLIASSKLPTPWGTFTLVGFKETASGKDHAALVMGDITTPEPVLAAFIPNVGHRARRRVVLAQCAAWRLEVESRNHNAS
jgi:GTP cyclohydrolase II